MKNYKTLLEENLAWAKETFEKVNVKMSAMTQRSRDKVVDGVDENGFHVEKHRTWWTNGFWGGLNYMLYAYTKNEEYLKTGKRSEELMDVALAKSLAERARIKKIEHSGLKLTFVTERPDLSVWSELFATNRSLSFVGLGSPLIVYRLRKDEDPATVAAKIMMEYVEIMDSNNEVKNG